MYFVKMHHTYVFFFVILIVCGKTLGWLWSREEDTKASFCEKDCDIGTSEPKFETEYGIMVGKKVKDSDVFLGVPYAKPPVGDLRFKDPEPREKCKEVQINTKTNKPNCMQSDENGSANGDEDCLYLNIFKPSKPATEDPLPVLLFFPGGNFLNGGCSNAIYNATILAPNISAIVVCATYRLGAFGFLYYKDEKTGTEGDILGNFGIKDQNAALKFVSENIGNLGGDPNKITISGESAGAQSVAVHLTSEQDNDLFRQAILMSDPFSISFKLEEEALKLSELFLEELWCKGLGLTCLHERSAKDILRASDNCSLKRDGIFYIIVKVIFDFHRFFNDKATHMAQPWGPTVTVQPITLFKSVEKPIMIGSLSAEARLFTPSSERVHFLNFLLPKDGAAVIDEYRKWYHKEREIFVHFLTDYIFTCPTRFVALDINSPPVYHYYFDHALSFAENTSFFRRCKEFACHAEDLPFFFQSASAMGLEFTKDEEKLLDIYSAFLANFIHHGNPNTISDDVQPERANLNMMPAWKPVDPRDHQTMVFSTKERVECKIGIRQKQCDFLDKIGYYDVPKMN